jgi:hypothetical protein
MIPSDVFAHPPVYPVHPDEEVEAAEFAGNHVCDECGYTVRCGERGCRCRRMEPCECGEHAGEVPHG